MTIPQHIAIIMDGNGRWAKQRGLPRTAGHKKGAETLKNILKYAREKGVSVVTLFAFSSENWNRPKEEVDTLMDLFRSYLTNDVQELIKQGIRISFIGNRQKFALDIKEQMDKIEAETKNLMAFHVVLALSYGARDDIVFAVQKIAERVQQGHLLPTDITGKTISDSLSTAGIIEPDLVIRTSGEERISNFLLWELAYAELYFTPVYWPDFNESEFDKALESYQKRQRRFGGLNPIK
ncbi:MAG: isoprenyl transferase [Alphaproteobacteria bacterium]|nr:isoprenyl transferase [Alphaproteobacteria bacterium]